MASGRYGLRSKESPAKVFKSPSKLLAEQLETISFGNIDECSNQSSTTTEKKLRSAFQAGRKSCKENLCFGKANGAVFDKTPSPPREEPVVTPSSGGRTRQRKQGTATAKSIALHTRPDSSASNDAEKPAAVSPVGQKEEAAYHDAMLPSFTSFGRRKTKAAGPTKRRAKKLILEAVTKADGEEKKDDGGEQEEKGKPAAKLPPIDLSWLNIDDLADLIVPELENRRHVAEQLMQRYRREFGKWVVQLLSGFNLLLHGLGSKRSLLTEFCDTKLLAGGFNVVELDGWRPDFSFSDFVKELFFNYCHQSEDLKLSDAEMIGRVANYLEENPGHLVILVHSIDGVEIRGNSKFHATLASLARLERVHVLASADHVNFPLMWDTATVENFNWIYMETPTFEPPVTESRSNECSLLRSILRAHSTTGAHVTLTSVRHVVFSLTPNAIKMFVLLCYIFVEKQARRTAAKKAKKGRSKKGAEAMEEDFSNQNDDEENITAADLLLPLSILYKHCRDQFIVSSFELMLKHLRELFDHTLAKQVKHPDDGVDCLQMNMTSELAGLFLDECRSGEYAQFLESLSTDIEL